MPNYNKLHHIENTPGFKGLKVNEGIPQPESVNHESVKRFLKKSRQLLPVTDYISGILRGDITILSKAVTLVESSNAQNISNLHMKSLHTVYHTAENQSG
jgi:LAO/AO transport system kinase